MPSVTLDPEERKMLENALEGYLSLAAHTGKGTDREINQAADILREIRGDVGLTSTEEGWVEEATR